jgi:IS5 family transposase
VRPKKNLQEPFDFQPSNLKVTQQHFARYEKISKILDANPKMLDLVHRELGRGRRDAQKQAVGRKRRVRRDPTWSYESDTIFRILLVQALEGWSLRETVVQVDDSGKLRRFTRLNLRGMMDYSTLCIFKNQIRPETWEKINRLLAEQAIAMGAIEGQQLRMDTTAVETNVHYPTDSSLLWDVYRVYDRWIRKVRDVDPEAVGDRRARPKEAKRLYGRINRKAGTGSMEILRPLYFKLISSVEQVVAWAKDARDQVQAGIASGRYEFCAHLEAHALLSELAGFENATAGVISQAQRRVFDGESVPNGEKVYSIFESHTELIKRGKAGKPVEFGHMVQIEQVEGKFVTGYAVFPRRPNEADLVDSALDRHVELFGHPPQSLAADKGYYRSMEELYRLEKQVDVVSIGKKGRRSPEEEARESSVAFKLAQAFRSGVEGTISYLKRSLRLARCFNKGWEHYQATVGATIFGHNLFVLARC